VCIDYLVSINYAKLFIYEVRMIMLTNQDTGKPVILQQSRIIRVDDIGSFRMIIYQVTDKEFSKLYVVEDVLEIWRLCHV